MSGHRKQTQTTDNCFKVLFRSDYWKVIYFAGVNVVFREVLQRKKSTVNVDWPR